MVAESHREGLIEFDRHGVTRRALEFSDRVAGDVAVPLKRIRNLATVRSDDEVEDVLATMQRTGAHLARVVDPEGVVTGVVFLEDVLEELVGEVTDASQR